MIINFKTCEINRGTRKLLRTSMVIKIKIKTLKLKEEESFLII